LDIFYHAIYNHGRKVKERRCWDLGGRIVPPWCKHNRTRAITLLEFIFSIYKCNIFIKTHLTIRMNISLQSLFIFRTIHKDNRKMYCRNRSWCDNSRRYKSVFRISLLVRNVALNNSFKRIFNKRKNKWWKRE
jgi:hypothetical protein